MTSAGGLVIVSGSLIVVAYLADRKKARDRAAGESVGPRGGYVKVPTAARAIAGAPTVALSAGGSVPRRADRTRNQSSTVRAHCSEPESH